MSQLPPKTVLLGSRRHPYDHAPSLPAGLLATATLLITQTRQPAHPHSQAAVATLGPRVPFGAPRATEQPYHKAEAGVRSTRPVSYCNCQYR